MARKLLIVSGAVAAVAVVVVAALFGWISRTGETAVERLVAQRLVAIANHYLNPRLSLSELDYQYPRTVVVRDARLTTSDGRDVLAIEQLELVFAQVPRQDRPLRIERMTLTSPRVYVADSLRVDGRIAGWSELLKPDAAVGADAPSDLRLSDVFQMRQVQIVDGHVIYADLNAQADDRLPVMDLAGIHAQLNVQPDAQGWYVIDTAIAGPAKFQATVKGRLDLDDLVLELSELALRMRLDRETDAALPPAAQQLLRRYEVTGRLVTTIRGRFPLLQLHQGQGEADVRLENARAVLDDVVIDLSEVTGEVVLRPNKIVARRLDIKGYEGSAAGRFSVALGDESGDATDVQFTGDNLRIERLVKSTVADDGDKTLPLGGRLSFATQLNGPLMTLDKQASGSGWLEVTEGSLARLPLLARLQKLAGFDSKDPPPDRPAGRDTARVEWTYEGHRARLTRIDALTRWMAVRGDGDLGFDGSLDLRLNAGPLERVQHALGKVGDILGSVTDRLVTYTVTGKVWDPHVRIRPLGLSAAFDAAAQAPPASENAASR